MDLRIFFVCLANVVAAVTIVLLNKAVLSRLGISPWFIGAAHPVTTACISAVVELQQKADRVAPQGDDSQGDESVKPAVESNNEWDGTHPPLIWYVLMVGFSLGSSIFSHIALSQQGVGQFQFFKMIGIPMTALFEKFLGTITVNRVGVVGLLLVCVGICQASLVEIRFSWWGSFYALLSTCFANCTVLTQRHTVTTFKVPIYLIMQRSMVGVALVSATVFACTEDGESLKRLLPLSAMVTFIPTCFLGAFLTYTAVTISAARSVTLLVVLANVKAALVVFSGAVVYGEQLALRHYTGLLFSVSGLLLYSLREELASKGTSLNIGIVVALALFVSGCTVLYS
mmetsp:Transcript_36263/g.71273  ORF Transcript_36263/g.71273 Transcript_36263/m.71273 type:complete len:342 (-) Transcript_36263:105-1130(-)